MSQKLLVLAALAVGSFASGVVDQTFYPGQEYPPTALGFTLVAMFLIFLWYWLDARQIGYRRSRVLDVGVIALAVVALPYYFFRSRGAWRGVLATLVMLLAIALSSALSVAGAYAAFYGLQS